ncbi:hypothetical protein F4703DRAFT_1084799 [Phycomyces blakesleeanus]
MMRKQESCCLDRVPQETMTEERLFHDKTLSRSPARPKPIPNGNKLMQHRDQIHSSPSNSLISSSPWSIVSNDAFNQDESGEVSTPLSETGSNSKGGSFEFMNSPRTTRSFGCFSNSPAGTKDRAIAVVPTPHSRQKISLGWTTPSNDAASMPISSATIHRPQNIDNPRQDKTGSYNSDKSIASFRSSHQKSTRQAPARSGIAIARAKQEEMEEDDGFQLIRATFSNAPKESNSKNDASLEWISRPLTPSKNSPQKYSFITTATDIHINNGSPVISPKILYKPSRTSRQISSCETSCSSSSVKSHDENLDSDDPNFNEVFVHTSPSSFAPPIDSFLRVSNLDQCTIYSTDTDPKALSAHQKKHLKPTLRIATDACCTQILKPTLLQSLLPNTVADGRYETLFDTIQDQGIVDGELVKALWRKSHIPDRILGHLWDQCDPNHQGLLDKQAFIQGMRAIDAFLLQHSQAVNL